MGRPRKNQNTLNEIKENNIQKYICYKCGTESKSERHTPVFKTELFKGVRNHAPICRKCLQDLYLHFLHNVYDNDSSLSVKRICCMYNLYYNSEILDVVNNTDKDKLLNDYLKTLNLKQYESHKGKTFDNTITEEKEFEEITKKMILEKEVSDETKLFFGVGVASDEEYIYLQNQYDDWTSRYECNNKSQEEIFKQICFVQLDIVRARRKGIDTRDLQQSFLKLLDSANIQPKQIATNSDDLSNVFGVRISDWENSDPTPDIDESLQDVDNIGRYIDVFFKGHLCKSMGIKNIFSNLYQKFMKKYTVEKPEYEDDEGNDALFDAIFGADEDDV